MEKNRPRTQVFLYLCLLEVIYSLFCSREESTSVAVGTAPEENKCFVCHEELDEFFHEESEEWHLKDAVRVEGITFHRLCYRDHLSNMVV